MNAALRMLRRHTLVYCRQPLSYSYVTAIKRNAYCRLPTVAQIPQACLCGSSLFVSDRDPSVSSIVQFDHALKTRLKDKQLLKENLILRGLDIDVDELEQDYQQLLDLQVEKEKLEETRENIAKQVASIVKHQKANKTKSQELATAKMKSLIQEGKEVKQCLKNLMVQFWNIEEKVMLAALSLPNTLHNVVSDKLEIMEEYFTDRIPASCVDHFQLLEQCNDVKLSDVGIKAYYLQGRLAILEQELIRNVCSQFRENDFTQMLAPEIFKTPVVESGGLELCDPASVYRLKSKQGTKDVPDWDRDLLFLCGSSPLSFLAYFSKLMINKDSLPVKMFTVGRHYTPETPMSESLPGLFGVLQSTQICICGLCCTKDEAEELSSEFISNLKSIYKQFNLPFRMVSIPAVSLSVMEQNRIELQVWVPSLKQYIKMASVSLFGDYCSRRLMIRQSLDDKLETSLPVLMVHGEVMDVTKMIGLLLEYGQTNKHWNSSDQ